jgi:hypothetical protein
MWSGAMHSARAQAFRFSTKARNLAQLSGRLRHGRTLDQEVLWVGAWQADAAGCLSRLAARFGSSKIIVRSSAPGEDSFETSMAGAFKSIGGMLATDAEALGVAVQDVVSSYAARRRDGIQDYEILVQPMIEDVLVSGVVFTRDLDKNGPYFVINYDEESRRTDTVTAGLEGAHKVVRVFKGVDAARLDPLLRKGVEAARELEAITGTDALDIEFVIDSRGILFVLQVRPLARRRILSLHSLDRQISTELHHAREFIRERCAPHPHLFGSTTIFGEMPDWNPAEIIGTQPKPLAWSLYGYIIMRSVWREARGLMGYREPFPSQLLVEIAGRPYVDVRCSFNSFLPATLREELCEKLVNHYLAELRGHPEFHDKVEFEIVITCLVFDFERQAARLEAAGFGGEEIEEIRAALFLLTDGVVNDRGGMLARLEKDVSSLERRRKALLAGRQRASSLMGLVQQLLDDCMRYGTLPFSVFARCAFIGTAFLRSLVQRGALTQEQYEGYLRSIDTVAGDLVESLERCKEGLLGVEEFLERYGHLRPGTYDICAYSYAERPELYLGVSRSAGSEGRSPAAPRRETSGGFPPETHSAIERLLGSYGFTFDVAALDCFIVRSIQLREAVKLEFTKNLSAALSVLVDFGKYHGLSRDGLAFVPIEWFLALANRSAPGEWIDATRELIERNRKRYEITGAISLPDLVFSEADAEVISLQQRRPNFITQKRIVAPSCRLREAALEDASDLEGHIILIENADPGYDWLFGRKIAGLVTKYGGAASHMTIRCAEFALPAAIGCGEQIFAELAKADSIILDCAERKVAPNV